VAQHQSRCLIFANQQLKVSNIFVCSCCFRPIAIWLSFHFWPMLINPFTDCFHWAKLPTLFRKSCNNCSVSKTKFPQCLDPSLIFLQYFTHNRIYRPNCDYDLKYWRIYYNTKLHVNIKIMTSQQIWYLLLNCFNNKINFLVSCIIRSWSVRFHQFDIHQVNRAQSHALVHSIVTNGAKTFRHFWDIPIFVLGYFILPHPVHCTEGITSS